MEVVYDFGPGGLRQIKIMDGDDILIKTSCYKEEDGWQIIISSSLSRKQFSFMYYGLWNKDKVAAEVLDMIDEYYRAKIAVFDRIFE